MASQDFNLASLRSRKFKGFLQFQDPDNTSNYLRLKERQIMDLRLTFNRDAHSVSYTHLRAHETDS